MNVDVYTCRHTYIGFYCLDWQKSFKDFVSYLSDNGFSAKEIGFITNFIWCGDKGEALAYPDKNLIFKCSI